MRFALLTLIVFLSAGSQPFARMVKESAQCTEPWQGTITYKVHTKKEGTAENKVNVSYWNYETNYEVYAQVAGRKTPEGAPLALVEANANDSREWGSRGKGICYRETDEVQKVLGVATENSSAFDIILNPRTREYSVLAPTLMVYASGEHKIASRVKGTCNNPYNKDVFRTVKIDRFQLSDDAPVLLGKGVIDPNKPNEISGRDLAEHDTPRGKKTVTITWNLRRCSGKSS